MSQNRLNSAKGFFSSGSKASNFISSKIWQLLERAANDYRESLAVKEISGLEHSYGELYKCADSLSLEIAALKLLPKTRVGICISDSALFIQLLFALRRCDLIVMPLGAHLSISAINELVKENNLSLILTERKEAKGPLIPLRSQALNDRGLEVWKNSNEIYSGYVNSSEKHPWILEAAFIRASSGTTGRPKGVILSEEAALQRIDAAQDALSFAPGDRLLWLLPMSYHFIVTLLLFIREGVSVGIASMSRPKEGALADFLNTFKATHCLGSPAATVEYAELIAKSKHKNQLRKVYVTGEKLSHLDAIQIEASLGVKPAALFGNIEVGLPFGDLYGAAPLSSVGKLLPRYDAEVRDAEGKPLPANTRGRLYVRGPGMFSGYTNPERAASEILSRDYFSTGDIASFDDNNFFYIHGREHSSIVLESGTITVEELEESLRCYPGLISVRLEKIAASSTAELHSFAAEVVVAASEGWDMSDFIEWSCGKMCKGLQIVSVRVVDEIPRNEAGKVSRK